MPRRCIEVIESYCYRNKRTGVTASPYGACPWYGDADSRDWERVSEGWTWRMNDGTIGIGRQPAPTREEAQERADTINAMADEIDAAWAGRQIRMSDGSADR